MAEQERQAERDLRCVIPPDAFVDEFVAGLRLGETVPYAGGGLDGEYRLIYWGYLFVTRLDTPEETYEVQGVINAVGAFPYLAPQGKTLGELSGRWLVDGPLAEPVAIRSWDDAAVALSGFPPLDESVQPSCDYRACEDPHGLCWDRLLLNDSDRFAGADLHGLRSLAMYAFTGADLSGADLTGTDLGVDLGGTNLTGADLHGADLSKAINLDSAILDGIRYDETTRWPVGFAPPKSS